VQTSVDVPPLVARLLAEGPAAELSPEASRFDEGESLALVRHYHALLGAADSDAIAATVRGVGEAAMAKFRHPQPLACKKGCAWCCFQLVAASGPEVFAIARAVAGSALADKVRDTVASRVIDPDRQFDLHNPCAFLDRGACSIHPVRPLACRYYASFDVQGCMRRVNDAAVTIPYPGAHIPLRQWQQPLLYAALAAAGLPAQDYELGGAVAIVLADPGSEARWYAGDDALAPAAGPRTRPGAAMLAEAARWRELAGL